MRGMVDTSTAWPDTVARAEPMGFVLKHRFVDRDRFIRRML